MKKVIIICCIILIIFIILGLAISIIINTYVKKTTKSKIKENIDEIPKTEAILILGCEVKPNGELSRMLKDRLDKGIELYKAKVAPKIIVSGDHIKEDYDEVNAMKDYLIDNGIASADIFMDHAGIATYDTMYRAKYIFGLNTCIVVTQEYHLYRTIYIGEQLEIETFGSPAKKINYTGQLGRDFREFLARNKDFVKCIWKPEAKHLGESISVNGNGDITNDE